MARFCPYCGKQINQRAKFCPLCGKSIPVRERTGPLVIEEARAVRPVEIPVSRPIVDRPARVEERPRARASNGSHARFAPATHVVIGESEQAGFGLRYGAWMFDFLLTMMAMMGFTFALTAVSRRSVVGSNRDLVLVLVLTLVLFLLNFIVLAGRSGQTVGMRILGIRIERTDGSQFTIRGAIIRHLLGYPLSVASFFLGFLWMLWDPRQQGWHDKLARTIVVMCR
ncbi:MAG: RDD family protein [Acidobacteriota bacterium]